MKLGDKVICIDNKNLASDASNFDKLLIEGGVYHIREIVPGYQYMGQPDGIKLDEIKGKTGKVKCYDGFVRYIETHFKKCRFKVIEEIDIQVVQKIRQELITELKSK